MVVRIRPVKVYFCSFLNLLLSIGCYPERKTTEIMINNVVLLFSATSEETPYPFPLVLRRERSGGQFPENPAETTGPGTMFCSHSRPIFNMPEC